jgi:choline kinase
MEVIVPAAGLSTRFPNMRPKYTLTDFSGKLMIEQSIAPFLGKHHITIGILKEHNDQYKTAQYLEDNYPNQISVVILENRTKGPADTVYQIIQQIGFDAEPILVKDCDSFFDYPAIDENAVCVARVEDYEIIKRLSSKSFIVSNDQGIIIDIIEKQVVSNKFCVGGYKFESAKMFTSAYNQLQDAQVSEIFVSHIIEECLNRNVIFKEHIVSNYVDVGTAEDWFDYNDKSVIFCDIDGTVVKAQGRHEWNDKPVPLTENILRLQELVTQGSKIIFTTARPSKAHQRTYDMLGELGFKDFDLISNLPNVKRILINYYNNANPYPRAIAVNLKRDSDNLNDFL